MENFYNVISNLAAKIHFVVILLYYTLPYNFEPKKLKTVAEFFYMSVQQQKRLAFLE